ncbi:hypothetical protein WG936_04185 [Corynebacterium sp. H127]
MSVMDSGTSDIETLVSLANQHQVQLAKVSYTNETGAPHRVIAVLNPKTRLPAGETAPSPDSAYAEYGFSTTDVQHMPAEYASPLGKWTLYGASSDVSTFITTAEEYFSVSADSSTVAASLLSKEYFSDPLWFLQVGGVLAVFVAALVSASTTSRVRAVKSLHGAQPLTITATESARYLLFGLLTVLLGWGAWAIVGLLGWGGTQLFAFPGLVFALIVAIVGALAGCATSAAVGIVVTAVPRVLDQVKGKRPLGIVFLASTITLALVLSSAFIGLGYSESALRQAHSAKQAAAYTNEGPDAFEIALWGTKESEVRTALPAWRSFVDAADSDNRLFLSALDLPGRSPYITAPRPCIVLNPTSAQHLGLLDTPLPSNSARILVPPSQKDQTETLKSEVRDRLQFERQLDSRHGISTTIPLADVEAQEYDADSPISIFATGNRTLPPGPVFDPIILIIPTGALSSYSHISLTSSGAELFAFEKEELLHKLRENAAHSLVAWFEQPQDSARAQLVEAQQRIVHHAISTSILTLITASIGALLAAVYAERRRQPLFVQHIHGAPLWRRYGSFFLLTLPLTAIAFTLGPASTLIGWCARIVVLCLSLAAGGLALRRREQTLSLEMIKHP